MAGTVGGAAGELRDRDQSQDGRGASGHALRQGRNLTQHISDFSCTLKFRQTTRTNLGQYESLVLHHTLFYNSEFMA